MFVIPRYTELAASKADLSLVLVALVGGSQPTVSPTEFWAHLSSMLDVSEGMASFCAWLGAPLAHERQDGRPSSSREVVGLEAEADLGSWS